MIYARFCIFARIFMKTENKAGTFLTKRSEPRRLTAGPGGADWNPDTDVAPTMAPDRGLPVRTVKRIKKWAALCPARESNSGPAETGQSNQPLRCSTGSEQRVAL
jgi:hypothetical protein